MVTHLYKDFLSDPREYRQAEICWLSLWEHIETASVRDGWTTPWLHTGSSTILDGNPIFSAFSPIIRRGIRIIQHAPTTSELELAYWLDTFGGPITNRESIQELVIACALSDAARSAAGSLMNAWVAEAQISINFPPADEYTCRAVEIRPPRSKSFVVPAA